MTDIEQAREVFGDKVAHLSDEELQSYLSKIDFLLNSWLDGFERTVFDGKTIQELSGKVQTNY
jgi:hypothetical protein